LIVVANDNDTTNNASGIGFGWFDTDDNPAYLSGSITCHMGAATTGQYRSGEIAFCTSSATNNAPSEKIRISTGGYLGIGTASPSEELHVMGNAIIDGGTGVSTSGTLVVRQDGDTVNDGIAVTSSAAGSARWYVDGSNIAHLTRGATNVISLAADATNVGIGETAPLKKLHLTTSDVAGTITPKYDNAIVLETNSTAGINMFMNDLSEGGLNFGQTGAGDNNTTGEFIFSNYDNHFRWMISTSGAAATEKMRILANGNVGIGTTAPTDILDISISGNNADMPIVHSSGTEAGWQMHCTGTGGKNWNWHSTGGASGAGQGKMVLYNLTDASVAMVVTAAGNVGITGGTTAFTPSSTLTVTGSVSKSSGSFKIDHPIPAKKDTHWLVHSFVESPRADLIYRGKIDLVDGFATVNVDTVAGMTEGTFVLLCDDVQCFTSNETDWDAVKGSVSGNTLTIESQNSESTATISWMVIGDRKDEHMLDTEWTDESGKPIVEPLKETE
jgi:hypothetical protein